MASRSHLLLYPSIAVALLAVLASPAHSAWSPCGVSPVPSSARQEGPAIAVDPTIGVLVAWNETREDSLRFDSFVQRLTAEGDFATGWPSGGLALPGPSGRWSWAGRNNVAMLADGRGGVFVVDGCKYTQGHAQLHRVTSDGAAPEWPVGGVTVSAFASPESNHARDPDIESPQGNGPGDCSLPLRSTAPEACSWRGTT